MKRDGSKRAASGPSGTSRRKAPRPEIGLLGGSFNPPHVAHMMAAYWTLATQPVSEVWLLPAYKHPFGKALAPFRDRVRMCELAARALRGVRVCDAEAELVEDPLVGKTARTLEHLASRHPRARFALIVGTDVLRETNKWYRWDRVQELARIVVVGRTGYPDRDGEQLLLPEISSSDIRARIERGEDVTQLVPAPVIAYIRQRKLYR